MNRIASYLKGKFDDDEKFRWYVKKKDFRLMDVPELSLRDVLVVPVKEGYLMMAALWYNAHHVRTGTTLLVYHHFRLTEIGFGTNVSRIISI